jgi:predicted enzyme related to lactoylglutathione lyase
MARITGIGGVFIRAKGDSKALAAWYEKNLGLKLMGSGLAILRWPDDKAPDRGTTAWQVFDKDSKFWGQSEAGFAINYRVDNMDEMVAQLERGGVKLHEPVVEDEIGKFASVIDPEGNKVALWEPTAKR